MRQKSLKKNSIFYLIYNVLNVLFPFITGVYVARVLFPDTIGQVAYAQNIVSYFVILAYLGLPTYGLREVSRARKNQADLNKLYSELILINILSTSFFSVLYLIVIFTIPIFSENITLYLIVGITLIANIFNNSWLYEGLEEFTYISIRNIVFKALAFICLVCFVRDSSDYLIYAVITTIGTVGNYLLNTIHSRKFVHFTIHGLNLKRHIKPIILLVAVNLAIEIYTLVDTTMLGWFCDDETVAFYTYGNRIYKILLQIVNTFTMVLVPRISEYYKEGKFDEFNELLTKVFRIIIILSLPMILGIQFVGDFLICKIYGDMYISSSHVLRILSLLLLFSPLGYLLGSRVLLVAGHEIKMVLCVGIGAIVNIIGNLILIPLFQEYGASLASVISEFIVMVVYILNGKRYFKLANWHNSVIKGVVATCLMVGYLFGCSYIPINEWILLCIKILGAVLIYFGSLLLLRESTVVHYTKSILAKFKHDKSNDDLKS